MDFEDPSLDYEQLAIHIMVKFRQDEPLQLLTGQRQSGGERAVSTILYLIAIQVLCSGWWGCACLYWLQAARALTLCWLGSRAGPAMSSCLWVGAAQGAPAEGCRGGLLGTASPWDHVQAWDCCLKSPASCKGSACCCSRPPGYVVRPCESALHHLGPAACMQDDGWRSEPPPPCCAAA